MSVVVGVKASGGVWLGADSYMSDPTEGVTVAGKIFMVGHIGFGVVGCLRHAQAIEHHLSLAGPKPRQNVQRWAVKELVPMLKELCDEHEILSDDDEGGLTLLAAVRGEVLLLQPDWAIFAPMEGYAAVGSGSPVALGALYSAKKLGAKSRIETAVRAACHHVPNVAEPVHMMWVPA